MVRDSLKRGYESFFRSFKLDSRFFQVVLLDLLFVLILLFLYSIWNDSIFSGLQRTSASMATLQQDISAGASINPNSLEYITITSFVRNSLFYSILLAIFFFFSFVGSRFAIWLIILGKIQNLKKFFLLNLIWQPMNLVFIGMISIIVIILSALLNSLVVFFVKSSVPVAITFIVYSVMVVGVIIPIILFFIHLTNLLYVSFAKVKRIKNSFVTLVKILTGKFSGLLFCYVAQGFLLYLLFILFYFLRDVSNVFITTLLLLLVVLFASWTKFYIYSIANT
jgi:hypothetical protein